MPLLPKSLLSASVHLEGERIVPHYCGPRDQPWLHALLAEYAEFVGRKRTELYERLRESLSSRAPQAKLRIAMAVLDAQCRARPSAAVPAKEARAALFRAASDGLTPRAALLTTVATSFAVTSVELEHALFADLRSEWRVAELPASLSAARLSADANLAIAMSLVRRAAQVRIVVHGNFNALLRQARVTGLICRASRLPGAADGVVLDVSGPFALFRHSQTYERALASLVPCLARCEQFELIATCALGGDGQLSSLTLRSGDPLGTGGDLRCESRVEQNFARDFRRAAPNWELVPEPAAIVAGETLIFPDFELVPSQDPNQSWLLEIVGFWTPEYLRQKLQRLRAAGLARFVLCVGQSRECAQLELPLDPSIIGYKTRIDARALLALITAARLA